MFQFNFGKQTSSNENVNHEKDDGLDWLPVKKIDISDYKDIEYVVNAEVGEVQLKLVDINVVTSKLIASNCEIISEAESQHSDLLPAKYEGGLKIWECTYDLGNYLLREKILLNDKTVLDLGCGAGILGIIALTHGSTVDFQDYNAEVINNVTIPNVIVNSNKETAKTCNFYCGDWKSFESLLTEGSEKRKYDYIFTSETIYNSNNHRKLYNVFKNTLKNNGVGYVAGKSLYFGVGGTMRQFEQLVLEDSVFKVSTVWKSETGVQREILKLQRNNST